MDECCVYILECADGSYYIGWTDNLERRVRVHNAGKGAKYTRSRLPVHPVYREACADERAAKSREFALKKLTRKQKEALVREYAWQNMKSAGEQGTFKYSDTIRRHNMDYGLQLFSIRDITKDDFTGALEKVREIGYTCIEPAGFFGCAAEDLKAVCDRLGLRVSGSHSSLQELQEDYENTVAYHKAIGNTNYIIPFADLKTKAGVDAFVSAVNELGPMLEKDGIRLSYHNHSFEFFENEDGIIPYDEIVSRTAIGLEIDTYWAYVAGKDPVQMMEELKDRLTAVHIKDGSSDGKGKPLGLGTAPVAKVYKKAKELGVLMVVESETLQPDGLTEVGICYNFLKSQE